MNKLYIDGKDVTGDVQNIDDFKITFLLDSSTKVVGEQISEGLVITGDTYKDVRKEYFENCNGFDKITPSKFHADICGGIDFDMFISLLAIEDDPCNCEMKIPFETLTDDRCCFQELNATEWYTDENNEVDAWCMSYDFPLVPFVVRPNFLQIVIWFITLPMRALFSIVGKILDFIGKLLAIVTFGFVKIDLNPYDDLFKILDEWIAGTNRFVPAPLMRDVMEYQTAKCGMTFQSSIWQDPESPYYNEVMACFETGDYLKKKDINDQEEICKVFLNNAPNISTIDLLKKFEFKYLAECRIINGVLIFEHEKYWHQVDSGQIAFDLVQLCEDELIDEKDRPIYSYKDEDLFAGVRLSYSQDAQDKKGNKLMGIEFIDPDNESLGTFGRYKYNYSFGLNLDSDLCKYSPHLIGGATKIFPFGAAAFMNDNNSSASAFERVMDQWIGGSNVNFGNTVGNLFASAAIASVGSTILGVLGLLIIFNELGLLKYFGEKRRHDLVMSDEQAQFCKVLILEDGFDRKDAIVKNTVAVAGQNPLYNYQTDQWVDQLFSNFHYYLDPAQRAGRLKIKRVVIPCDCDVINKLKQYKTELVFKTHYGLAKAEEWEISANRDDPSISITNITVFCDI